MLDEAARRHGPPTSCAAGVRSDAVMTSPCGRRRLRGPAAATAGVVRSSGRPRRRYRRGQVVLSRACRARSSSATGRRRVRAEPRPEPDSGNPTVRDRRGASGNVASWSMISTRRARLIPISTSARWDLCGGRAEPSKRRPVPTATGLAQRYVERVVHVIDVIELSSVPSPAAPFAVQQPSDDDTDRST
jgi:hypothetical protein